MLEQDFGGRFATAILARLDFAAGGVALTVAAGRAPAGARLARAAARARSSAIGGTLLGIFADAAHRRGLDRAAGRATRWRSTPTASPRRTRRRGC